MKHMKCIKANVQNVMKVGKLKMSKQLLKELLLIDELLLYES